MIVYFRNRGQPRVASVAARGGEGGRSWAMLRAGRAGNRHDYLMRACWEGIVPLAEGGVGRPGGDDNGRRKREQLPEL